MSTSVIVHLHQVFEILVLFFEIISGHLADNHASTPPLSFLQAGCPSYHPTNSVKAIEMEKETRNGRHEQRAYSFNDFGAITLLTHLQSVHSSAVRARVVDC